MLTFFSFKAGDLQNRLKGVIMELRGLEKEGARLVLEKEINKSLFEILNLSKPVDDETLRIPFVELGFDSLALVSTSQTLQRLYEVDLDDFFFFQFGTIEAASKVTVLFLHFKNYFIVE